MSVDRRVVTVRSSLIVALALLLARPLVAQQPARDSAASDTARVTRGDGNPLLFGVAVAALLAAPSLFLLGHRTWDTTTALPSHDYAIYGSAGVNSGRFSNSLLQRGDLELLGHHAYGRLAIEDFGDTHLKFYTAQTGYFLRPPGGMTGGFVIGYRHATGINAEDAALVSLPVVFGGKGGAMSLEPTYVISRQGIDWNYRIQEDLYFLPHPFFFGVSAEAKPLYHGGDYRGSIALLVGVHR